MSQSLTDRQIEILDFIKAYAQQHGFAPSIRDIGDHFKIAPPSVLSHLKALERKRRIKREPHKSRCLEVLKFEDQAA